MGSRAGRAGQYVCGGWRGGFESWAGDWKERSLSQEFKRRNYQSTQLCDQCSAVQPHAKTPHHLLHLIYTNFALDAPWRSTIRNHDTYLQETPLSSRTPWLKVPGFNISRVRWDSAHTILLGIGKDVAAGFLWDVVSGQRQKHCFFSYVGVNETPYIEG